MNLFSGVFVATITPFDTDGVILWDALDEHIQFLVRSGVHGLVPCGTTGEASMLTTAERRQVIERTKKLAGSLPVIAGCGSNSTAVCLEMIREARQLGCAGALVVTPYYTKPTPPGSLHTTTSLLTKVAFRSCCTMSRLVLTFIYRWRPSPAFSSTRISSE